MNNLKIIISIHISQPSKVAEQIGIAVYLDMITIIVMRVRYITLYSNVIVKYNLFLDQLIGVLCIICST